MTIIESLRNFIIQCPYLDDLAPINVDYLGSEAIEYTIDSIPAEPIIKKYVDGSAVKQFVFVLGSREYYGPDVLQNIENTEVYENISKWFKEKSDSGELPRLSGNKQSLSIETMTSGYLFDSEGDKGRYQIQARLIYYEE